MWGYLILALVILCALGVLDTKETVIAIAVGVSWVIAFIVGIVWLVFSIISSNHPELGSLFKSSPAELPPVVGSVGPSLITQIEHRFAFIWSLVLHHPSISILLAALAVFGFVLQWREGGEAPKPSKGGAKANPHWRGMHRQDEDQSSR